MSKRTPFIKAVGVLFSRGQTSNHAKAIFKKTLEYHVREVFEELHLPSDRRCDVTTVGSLTNNGNIKISITVHIFTKTGEEIPRLVFERVYINDTDMSMNLNKELTDMVLHYLSKALYNRSGKVIKYGEMMSSWIPPTNSIKTHRAQSYAFNSNGLTISHGNVTTVVDSNGISFFHKD